MARLAEDLSSRDRQVLQSIALHNYLSTKHVEGLWFADRQSVTAERLARRTMTRLKRVGLIQPLERRVGGVRAGSSARVWQLSAAGRRLVASDMAKRPHEPSPRLLSHALAVADARLTIEGLARQEDSIERLTVQVEAQAWRRYLGLGGEKRLLQPDLAVVLHRRDDEGDFEDRWFIEVDCGTESMSTLLRKCGLYDDYRRTGVEQTDHDVYPRVLWILRGPRAETRVRELTWRLQRQSYPAELFVVVDPHGVPAAILGGE